MGTTQRQGPSGLADALFSPVQQQVLGLLFGQPDRRFQSAELIRLVGSGTGAVHRQMRRLAEAGLVTTTRLGNQKHYQANRSSPVFDELHGLVIKTVGMAQPIREALQSKADAIRAAFVFGSIAKRADTAGSDIDLMVISDELAYSDLIELIQPAEAVLARPINPTLLSVDAWREQRAQADSFVTRVASQPRVFVIGSEHDLD